MAVRHVDGDRHISGHLQEGHHRNPVHVWRRRSQWGCAASQFGEQSWGPPGDRIGGVLQVETMRGLPHGASGGRGSRRGRRTARWRRRRKSAATPGGAGSRLSVMKSRIVFWNVGPENNAPLVRAMMLLGVRNRGFPAEGAQALAEHHDLGPLSSGRARTFSSTASGSAWLAWRAFPCRRGRTANWAGTSTAC